LTSRFRISPNHLHIWPAREFMFIAIPSEVSATPPSLACQCSPCLILKRRHNNTGWLLYLHTLRPEFRFREARSQS
jgi:hypothetical protein